MIFFSKGYLENHGAIGKFIKFYVDSSKRALAWRLFASLNDLKKLKKREIRMLKKNKAGVCTLQIKGVLEELRLEPKNYKKLPVREYRDLLDGTYQYVQFSYPEYTKSNNEEKEENEE